MTREYSLARALAYAAAPQSPDAGTHADVELNASRRLSGQVSRGLTVPLSALVRMNATTAGDGPELIGRPSMSATSFQRPPSILQRAGATFLTGLRGDLHVPSMVAGAATGWLVDGEPGEPSMPELGHGAISPKTVTAAVGVSRRLMLQASEDVAALIGRDLGGAMLAEIDAAALGASADAGAPSGLRQALMPQRKPWAASGPTYGELLELLEDVEAGHQLQPVWLISPAMAKTLRQLDTGMGRAVLENGMIADHPALIAARLPDDEVIVGGFGDLLVAQWGGVDMRLDPISGAASDARTLRGFTDCGFYVRRLASFAFGGAGE